VYLFPAVLLTIYSCQCFSTDSSSSTRTLSASFRGKPSGDIGSNLPSAAVPGPDVLSGNDDLTEGQSVFSSPYRF
jgi:hypothetical protein